MAEKVRAAFDHRIVELPVASLLPRKKLPGRIERSVKFQCIAKSIAEVGIIEPLVVARLEKSEHSYLLLDGHVRLAVLADLGQSNVRCIIADDDEAFTYNKRVNRLATIQEHFMIIRALRRGVSEEKLAKALNVDVRRIKQRQNLLNGICPEVVELLKDKSVNPATFDILRKMKPMRQIEAAELMVTAGKVTASYAKALLAASSKENLVESYRPRRIPKLTSTQIARMESEMSSLQQDFKQIENSYGDDVLHLVIASGYLAKLVDNPEIERFLVKHHAEILGEFRAIIAATSLDQTQSKAA